MGNAQSSETTRRYSQKLSKPKTNSHATAGLLSPNGSSKSTKRLSNAPLPEPPLPPLPPMPMSPSGATTVTNSSIAEFSGTIEQRAGRSVSISSNPGLPQESKRRSLFRSRTLQGGSDSGRRERNAISTPGIVDRMSRTSSLTYESAIAYYGPPDLDEWSEQPQSQTSWNYNFTSYEAKRLLNLAEEPHYDRTMSLSEHRMTMVTETTWTNSNSAQNSSTPVTRANSDVSLYVPVRRRSIIQTPGVATRSNSMRHINPSPRFNARYSHPATPSLSRQQSIESYRSGIVSMPIPPRIRDLDPAPRALTPCEDEYLSIGAFKLGSLRITNGAASPISPDVRRGNSESDKGKSGGETDYFARGKVGATATAVQPRAVQQDCTVTTAVSLEVPSTTASKPAPEFLPAVSISPLGLELPDPLSPQLQTTSKHSALEDDLFEDDAQPEYSSVEVLDVRFDTNAKSAHVPAEAKSDAGLRRTDSGFMSTGSPSPESIHKPLAKADSGYSSNVSLRSFQQKNQNETESSTSVTAPKRAPPPVPPKDVAQKSTTGSPKLNGTPKKTQSFTNSAKENSPTKTAMSKARDAPTPIKSFLSRERGLSSPASLPRTPASEQSSKSDNSVSAMSVSVKPQRTNRLQRFLTSARRSGATSLEVHATHEMGKNKLPSIPHEVEEKLNARAGRFPMTTKRLALKPRASLDTLKTIFSVGSIETGQDVQSAAVSTKDSLWRQTLHIAHAASSIVPQKPVTRKPVPAPQETNTARLGSNEANPAPKGTHVATLDALVGRRSHSQPPELEPRRSLQLDLTVRGSSNNNPLELPSPLLPSPVARAMSMTAKTSMPPPVSMATRMQMPTRVPPPLRPQSSTSSLRRQASRENIQSHPAAHPSLARRSSRENIQSYPSYQQEMPEGGLSSPPPTMDPRRLAAFRPRQNSQKSVYGSQNWEVQTEHGLSRQSSYASLSGGSGRNSISSDRGYYGGYGSQEGYSIQRPSSAQPWMMQPFGPQPLRNRAGYEDHSYGRQLPQQGYPPSMSNGYTAPPQARQEQWSTHHSLSVASTWSRSQLDAAAGQWYQPGPTYPPYVPRGPYRKRSMSAHHGPKPPYRVLHSYNSPAYRNAPIWG
ncbi:hypothetical protein QBC42DRAFT_344882 [Cladorrhinum samala]|uniref:Proteophosphoglycan ppg4 n=1 Tax=Cladorrhinum samala TaxID=585594 RepID=A0AAV9HT91_9PEZI|nr:hypothetical protein QBC42DRAFT_344882 [Cladorrhinum samala]